MPTLSRGQSSSPRGSPLLRSCALTTSPRRRLSGETSGRGFLMEWQTVNRKGGGKGWNHGVQDQLMQSMTAMQNSISQLAQSICTRPPPGSKGQGKPRPSKGQGKGVKSSPGGTKESQPQARGGKSRADNRGSEMPEVSEHIQLDHQGGLPFVRLQASPGECLQNTPLSEEHWPGQRENWWGWIVFWCFLGKLLCLRCQRRNQPGRDCERREGHPAKESRLSGETACHVGKRRPSPRGSRISTRTAPSCSQRSSQPGSETRFSRGQNAQSRGQGPEVRRATPPGGSFLEICPRRKRRGQLRAESCAGKCRPKTARTPSGDAAMQLSSEDISDLTDMLKQCGLLAACEDASEAQTKKARTGPYDNPKKTP